MSVRERMERWEGREHKAYPDPLTARDPVKRGKPWTIGIGHTGPEVYDGLLWDDRQIDEAFDKDWTKFEAACLERCPWMNQLDEVRRFVFIAMSFQMGVLGLMGFINTLAAARDGHYAHAAELMRQSLWAHQTPGRAAAMSHQLETGEWQ